MTERVERFERGLFGTGSIIGLGIAAHGFLTNDLVMLSIGCLSASSSAAVMRR